MSLPQPSIEQHIQMLKMQNHESIDIHISPTSSNHSNVIADVYNLTKKTLKIVSEISEISNSHPIATTITNHPISQVINGPYVAVATTANSYGQLYNQCRSDGNTTADCSVSVLAGVATDYAHKAVGSACMLGSIPIIAVNPVIGGTVFAGGSYLNMNSTNVGHHVYNSTLNMFNTFNLNQCNNKEPIGCGWQKGIFNEYYRNNGNIIEKYNNGFTSYISKSDPCIPYSISSSISFKGLNVGGVKLEIEEISKAFSQFNENNNTNTHINDPVSLTFIETKPCLLYRNVKYFVDNINYEEFATAILLVFYESANEIAVSLEPNETLTRLIKIFKPTLMAQTNFGRTIMKSDELLKYYLSQYIPHFKVEEYLKNKKLDATKFRTWIKCDKIKHTIDKTNNIVTFIDNDMHVVYNQDEKLDEAGDQFCQKMNNELSILETKHIEFAKVRKYINLIALCKLLYIASNNTIDQSISDFVQTHLKPLEFEDNQTIEMIDFMGNVPNYGTISLMRGGVQLISKALLLTKPWRQPQIDSNYNTKQEITQIRTCEKCNWCIELYMECTLSVHGLLCQQCAEECNYIKYMVKYDGICNIAKNITDRIRNMQLAVEQRRPLIEHITPCLISININSEKDFTTIINKRMQLINMNGVTYQIQTDNDNHQISYKIIIHD